MSLVSVSVPAQVLVLQEASSYLQSYSVAASYLLDFVDVQAHLPASYHAIRVIFPLLQGRGEHCEPVEHVQCLYSCNCLAIV